MSSDTSAFAERLRGAAILARVAGMGWPSRRDWMVLESMPESLLSSSRLMPRPRIALAMTSHGSSSMGIDLVFISG